MLKAVAISNYSSQYQDPIVLKKGETVRLGQEESEEKWKGWIWAENETHGGWVPIQILKIDQSKLTAQVLEDYSAKELDVEKGDTITVSQQLNGWLWSKSNKSNDVGWVPEENIQYL